MTAIPAITVSMTKGKKKSAGRGRSHMSVDAVHALANWILVGSLIVGVVSTFVIVVSGNMRDRALRLELAQANKASAEAEERTEELRKQNLELQGAVLKMRREVVGRWLSTDQILSLLPKAEKFRGQRVIFEFDRRDGEAFLLVFQLQDNLGQLARWNVEYRLPATPSRFGVRIASTGDTRSREAAAMLVGELGKGFQAVLVPSSELLEEGTTLEEGTVLVRVDPRLPPFADIK